MGWKKEYLSRHLASTEHRAALSRKEDAGQAEVAFKRFHANEDDVIPLFFGYVKKTWLHLKHQAYIGKADY